MATLGVGAKWLGYLLFAVTGKWSFILELQIIYVAGGFGGFVLALLLGPVTFALAGLVAESLGHFDAAEYERQV